MVFLCGSLQALVVSDSHRNKRSFRMEGRVKLWLLKVVHGAFHYFLLHICFLRNEGGVKQNV